MKIAISGDFHFGDGYLYGRFDKATGVNSSLLDKVSSVRQMIKYCKENNVEEFVLTGDVFKEGNGGADQERRNLLSKLLKELSESVSGKLHILVGNHDIYGDTNVFSEIKTWSDEKVIVYEKPCYSEELNAVMLPYFNIKKIYNDLEGKEFNNIKISETMNSIVDGLYAKIPEDKRGSSLCFFHFTLSEAEYKEGVMTRWGHDIILSAESLSSKFKYSFGGHLHESQTINGNCMYHGAITQTEPKTAPRTFICYDGHVPKKIRLKHRKIFTISENEISVALSELGGFSGELDNVVIVEMGKPKSEYLLSDIKSLEQELQKFHRHFLKYEKDVVEKISESQSKILTQASNLSDAELIEKYANEEMSKENTLKMMMVSKKYKIFH